MKYSIIFITSTTNSIVGDCPFKITNSEGSEGCLGHGCYVGVGHILHDPDVLLKVVADDCFLYAYVGDDGVRGVLDLVGLIKEGISAETTEFNHGGLEEGVLDLAGCALLTGAGVLVDVLIPGDQPEVGSSTLVRVGVRERP